MINIDDYDYFIFDCDGVIINSNQIKNETFKEVLKNENVDLVSDFIKYHQDNGGVSRYEKFLYYYKNIKAINKFFFRSLLIPDIRSSISCIPSSLLINE